MTAELKMRRAVRVSELWNWLPAFRIVAETQHLPTAAKVLHVSPSALSRTLRLLEDRLGRPLFERQGRQLRLNSAGDALLAAVRDAMRQVDDGCQSAAGSRLAGPVLVSATPALSSVLMRAMPHILERHPQLQLELRLSSPETVHSELLAGDVDVAFHESAGTTPRVLERTALGVLTYGVYCGAMHPLFRATVVTPEDLAQSERVAPCELDPPAAAHPQDPRQGERIRLRNNHPQLGLELCLHSALLASMPDVAAEPWVELGRLRRLASSSVLTTRCFATLRRAPVPVPAFQAVLEGVRTHLSSARVPGGDSR